jgi:hypothetical protein
MELHWLISGFVRWTALISLRLVLMVVAWEVRRGVPLPLFKKRQTLPSQEETKVQPGLGVGLLAMAVSSSVGCH